MHFKLPDRSRELISPLVGPSSSNALVLSGSGIGSATSASGATPDPSVHMPSRPLEQAYQLAPLESVNHTCNGPTTAIPSFSFAMKGNREPQPEVPAWQLFEASMLQALNPDAQVSDGTEEVAPIPGSNSPCVISRGESAGREIGPSNLHDLDLIEDPPGDLPMSAEFGKIPRSMYGVCDAVQPAPKPTTMGSVDVEQLQDSEVLFLFGVFAIMARLNPRYQFKYGGLGGERVGMKLTLYGHTVFAEPNSASANEARVLGCRRALAKLRENNLQWPVPPEPNSGCPTGPEWNWPALLEEFCEKENWSFPIYNPTLYGSNTEIEWHCDISVNGRVFRTGCPSYRPEQAQNTAAHIALHTVLVHANIPPEFILPFDDPSFEFKKASGFKFKEEASADTVTVTPMSGLPARILNSSMPASVMDSMEAAFTSRGPRGSRGNGKGKKAQKRLARRGPKPLNKSVKAPTLPKTGKGSNPPKTDPDSNLIPLTKSRLAPLVIKPAVVEDPLARLRNMQRELGGMATDSSYHALLTRMCCVLKANMPEIRYEKNPDDSSPTGWMIRAWFDLKDPYLSRASPIMLATTPKMDEKVANSLGVKKLMLYLLRMTQEDVGLTSLEPGYARDFPFLKALEVEIEQRLMKDAVKLSK
ncbi:uncharacterized protein N7503_002781 [Penicillium pulvis]|uniref:uncharacterized protein n=1 Tax=Penicillium pulvis TaxID=1562058 RepID=UPI0025492617|nr:uncharacterized protein N7503_002781 [Penicillium pulvis]KAJ5810563.1 hypothetical protein N7503_002781 [Penicillium pulvis]